ncbi:MAG: TRAP transporter substrate-binding protein DctP [Gammaproteobacteria bacterium]|nr:TRAP transporter substrate-binding protein DctP [Gammaproteobacteria bacterium]
MRQLRKLISIPLLGILLVCHWGASAHANVVIKLGTIAPDGSIWHEALLETQQAWRELSNGEVELRIYAGGVLGGEAEMVRKMQRRGLDAITISGAGIGHIDHSMDCLSMPFLFDSYEELDFVRSQISSALERNFERRKFKLVNWAEVGWVHFFTTKPVRTPSNLRSLRLWTSVGDPSAERLFKKLGFQVVPLPVTDMLTALQTKLVEAIDVPPLFALLDRSYEYANHMMDLKFAPLNAATVMTVSAWERIPAEYRAKLLEVARVRGVALRNEVRQAEQQAIDEMKARGLQVIELSKQEADTWRSMGREAYEMHRCRIEYPEIFEQILRLHGEFLSK